MIKKLTYPYALEHHIFPQEHTSKISSILVGNLYKSIGHDNMTVRDQDHVCIPSLSTQTSL